MMSQPTGHRGGWRGLLTFTGAGWVVVGCLSSGLGG